MALPWYVRVTLPYVSGACACPVSKASSRWLEREDESAVVAGSWLGWATIIRQPPEMGSGWPRLRRLWRQLGRLRRLRQIWRQLGATRGGSGGSSGSSGGSGGGYGRSWLTDVRSWLTDVRSWLTDARSWLTDAPRPPRQLAGRALAACSKLAELGGLARRLGAGAAGGASSWQARARSSSELGGWLGAPALSARTRIKGLSTETFSFLSSRSREEYGGAGGGLTPSRWYVPPGGIGSPGH